MQSPTVRQLYPRSVVSKTAWRGVKRGFKYRGLGYVGVQDWVQRGVPGRVPGGVQVEGVGLGKGEIVCVCACM